MPTEIDLNQRLETLRADGTSHYEQFKRSNAELLRLLIATYLWWREARTIPGYLERQYKERDINWREGQEENFTPLIRLVFGLGKLDASERVTLVQWNKALRALHEKIEKDPGYFSSNPQGKLLDVAKTGGGISGLANPQDLTFNIKKPTLDPNPDPDPQPDPDPEKDEPLPDDEQPIVDNIANWSSSFDDENIKDSRDGLAALLIWPSEGSFSAIASSDNSDLIKNFVATVARRDWLNLSVPLRAITSVVQSQARPPGSLPTNRTDRAQWFQKDYGLDKHTTKHGQKLTVVRDDFILVTRSGKSPCVVSHCLLKTPALPDVRCG